MINDINQYFVTTRKIENYEEAAAAAELSVYSILSRSLGDGYYYRGHVEAIVDAYACPLLGENLRTSVPTAQ